MESSKVGYWLQVGANIGILAGLILVGLQINQNTDLARFNLYNAEEDGFLGMHSTMSGETLATAWAKAIESPETLSTAEMVQLDGFLENILIQLMRRDYLYTQGLYAFSAESQSEWLVPSHFGNAFARAWWQDKRQFLDDTSLKAAIDKAMTKVNSDDQAKQFDNIRKIINSNDD